MACILFLLALRPAIGGIVASYATVMYYTGATSTDDWDIKYYYSQTLRLYPNGTTSVENPNAVETVWLGDSARVAKKDSYYAWAAGKYVFHQGSEPPNKDVYPYLEVTGSHLDANNIPSYSVRVKTASTPTPTPKPTPTPTPTPSIDNRSYAWGTFGFPSDLSWGRLLNASRSQLNYIQEYIDTLYYRGYWDLSNVLARNFNAVRNPIVEMGNLLSAHRPRSAINRQKRRLRAVARLEAEILTAIGNNLILPDGHEADYDVRVPLQAFAPALNLAYQRARQGKRPPVGSLAWTMPACPSFTNPPPEGSLSPGLNTTRLNVQAGGAPMRGFAVTFDATIEGGDSLTLKVVSPWGQSWYLNPTYNNPPRSDGWTRVSIFSRLQALDQSRVVDGVWKFELTYSIDSANSGNGVLGGQNITFYPDSLW